MVEDDKKADEAPSSEPSGKDVSEAGGTPPKDSEDIQVLADDKIVELGALPEETRKLEFERMKREERRKPEKKDEQSKEERKPEKKDDKSE